MFNYLGKPTKEQKKITEELIKKLPKDKKYIINFTDDFSKTYKGGELKLNTEDYEKVKIRGMIGGAGGWVDDVFEIKINTKLPLYELRETLAHELGHSFYKEAPEKLFTTNQTSGNQFNFQEMGKKIVSRDEVVADHFADYLLNNKKYSEIYPDENKFFNKILVNNMPKYINTAKNEFYDLTDPNAPKLIGNMTDYAKTLAEKNFAGYKAGFENPASADLEKNWFIQRESGKIYQDLLRQTEFRDLTPTAPAPQAPVVKSGFDITPGQASQKQTDLYNAGEGEYAPTFKAAVAESGTAAINAPQIAQIGGQAPYFYGADVLGKKANDAAVNTLYRAYFGRDASAAELKNWGASGGADTTVKSLEDFLKSEQIKYNVPQGIKTLTPESFKPTATAVLPTGNLVDTAPQANALVAGAQTNLKEIMASLTPPETEADKKEQSLLDMMASLTGEQGQKAADQLTAEQSAGLPDLKKQFADINAQILTKAAEYNVLSTANQNKPITMASIIGQERAIMNAKAADIGLLQARAQGLQGQISVAQETVNRAIDLKYSTIEAQLNTYEAQLKALMPTLNKEEKIRAEARQMMIDNQKQALSDQKDKEKEINKLALSGYNYVSTPAERDRLKAQGYEIIQQSGRTYAKAPEIKAVKTRAAGGGGGGGGSGGGGTDEVSDFDYAKQIIEANPNIGDAELKSELLNLVNKKKIKLSVMDINSLIAERKEKQITEAEANKPQSFSQDWFKTKIETARSNDFSDAEIVDYIIKNFDINELFKTAKEAGFAKWYTGKETDIKRYINSLL